MTAEELFMKALGLVRISKNKFSSNFCCKNFSDKNFKSFFILLFCKYTCYFSGEHFNSFKIFHGRLKACKIFSCVKFMSEKSKRMDMPRILNRVDTGYGNARVLSIFYDPLLQEVKLQFRPPCRRKQSSNMFR